MKRTLESVLGPKPRYSPAAVKAGSRRLRLHLRPSGWFVIEDAGPYDPPKPNILADLPHIVVPLFGPDQETQ